MGRIDTIRARNGLSAFPSIATSSPGIEDVPSYVLGGGSNFPYHYLGSARTMIGIGEAFGEAMIGLEKGGPS